MTYIESIILGIVQGVTEFLPISSSGHLLLFQNLMGMNHLQNYIFFDLVCHLGTLLAIVSLYFKELVHIATIEQRRFVYLALGTLPLFPLVLVLKQIKYFYNQSELLWLFFLISSLLLFLGTFFGNKSVVPPKSRLWKDSLTIGLFQALAIFPGISRSGATISAAKMLGWHNQQAVTFSFLLAIPTILGGVVLEGYSLLKKPVDLFEEVSLGGYALGFLTSFFIGYLSLNALKHIINKDKLHFFGLYCLFLSIFCYFKI